MNFQIFVLLLLVFCSRYKTYNNSNVNPSRVTKNILSSSNSFTSKTEILFVILKSII